MTKTEIAEICIGLQALQRQRARYIKFRIMNSNCLEAIVAGTIGYHTGMTKAERIAVFKKAKALIKKIVKGEAEQNPLVLTANDAIQNFAREQKVTEKEMLKMVKQLPVASWVEQPEQRGFGLLFLAIVVGETGDLSNYSNLYKLWRRLGCAPYTKGGETLMGATWRGRGNGKRGERLHASDWEEFGYSPRRRSIAFLIGENIVKQNWIVANGDPVLETETDCAVPLQSDCFDESGDDSVETEDVGADSSRELDTPGDGDDETDIKFAGPYRARYDEAKKRAAEVHPEWVRCEKCDGSGTVKEKKCANCKGTGELWMHCHRHAMLLATKLLLKKLRQEWNSEFGERGFETETKSAELVEA